MECLQLGTSMQGDLVVAVLELGFMTLAHASED